MTFPLPSVLTTIATFSDPLFLTPTTLSLGAIVVLLCLTRISAFVAFMPVFGRKPVPNTVKIGIAICLTAVWTPTLWHQAMNSNSATLSLSWSWLAWQAIREAACGLALAWMLGLLFIPIRIAGSVIAQEMGLTMATLTSSVSESQSNVISEILETLLILAFLSLNGHHLFFYLLDSAWTSFPIVEPWTISDSAWIVQSITQTDGLGISISAPVLLCLLITSVSLLFIMRQTPQFNLMTFGMPVRLFVGMIALTIFTPTLMQTSLKIISSWFSSL